MKKLIVLFCFLGSVLIGNCAEPTKGIKFEQTSLDSILMKAATLDRLVFVDVYAVWCGPCKRMANEVFTRKDVGDYFNSTFVNAKFDAEKGEGIAIASKYRVEAYPTFLLLNSKGELVGKMVGGSPAEEFIMQIDKLKEKALANKIGF